MKVLLLLSDEKEKAYYEPIITLFKERNIQIEYFVFRWRYKTQNDCAEQIIYSYKEKDLSQYYIFGFSISAFIAILVATKTVVKGLILISPTPLFSDTEYPEWVKKQLGRKRLGIARLTKIISLKLNSKKNYLFVGEQEDNEVLRQSTAFAKAHKNVNYIVVKNTGHTVDTSEVLNSLRQNIVHL